MDNYKEKIKNYWHWLEAIMNMRQGQLCSRQEKSWDATN